MKVEITVTCECVAARFHEWAHAEYGEDSVYDHTYECSDLEAAYAAGYAARHAESPECGAIIGTYIDVIAEKYPFWCPECEDNCQGVVAEYHRIRRRR